MGKLKDNEYNCYVCYLPNCGEDYKKEIQQKYRNGLKENINYEKYIVLKNSGLNIQIFIINLIIIVNSGIIQKSSGKQDVGILQKNMMMKKDLKMIF